MGLSLQVSGSGPMAPMWEAMGAPLLPKFARAFAEQLAQGIEAEYASAGMPELRTHTVAPAKQGLVATFRRMWRQLFGRRA